MACTPLNIQNGLFINTNTWQNAPSASFDGKTLTLAAGGPNPGISVQQGTKSFFHAQLANHSIRYQVFGNKYLVIVDAEAGAGSSTRTLFVVNFTTWTAVTILTVLANSNSVSLPVVNPSQGEGAAFLAYGSTGSQVLGVGIYRSDTGAVLCPLGSPIVPTGQTVGEATATSLVIHYSTGGMSRTHTCPKPLGKCDVSPAVQSYPDAFLGGCPSTPQTRQFIVKNVGDDCLTVNSIGNVSPFSVQATSKPLPVSLVKNETVSVTVVFEPTAVGTWPATALPVTTVPANGASQLVCKGKALPAEFKIAFSSPALNFGTHPVGVPAPAKTLVITNSGSKPLNVSVPPLGVAGFSCSGFSGSLTCGQTRSLSVGFTPPAEGPQSAVLTVDSDAPGSPHTIALTGNGCLANALINVPPAAPIGFGQIQRGFRMVRVFEVGNAGDGQLTFTGSITGPDAQLFGLPDPNGSVTVTPPGRSYAVAPVTSCGGGASGSGRVLVAVSFFADDTPRLATATLTLSGHNATNAPAGQTWTFPLTAEIVPPVALDVALVIDRSGSMSDPLGSRVKMDVAVSAGQLFVELLRPDLDDRVAVVRFSDGPEVVVPMTHVSKTSAPTQATILQNVRNDVPPPAGSTAIAGGAMVGADEIATPRPTPPPKLTRALVVLTDGRENTAYLKPGTGVSYTILGEDVFPSAPWLPFPTQPMPHPAGVQTYAIGLGKSGDVDTRQLTVLADGNPNHVFRVDTDLTGMRYFQLEKYFTQIFMEIVDTSSVLDPMYTIAPGDTHEIEFDVLRGDVSALVVVYDHEGMRLPFFCLSPAGEMIDPSTVPPGFQLRFGATPQTRIIEFKVPQKEPERYAGRWKIVVQHPKKVCYGTPPEKPANPGFLPDECRRYTKPVLYGVAIGVGSNFRMVPLVTPAPVYAGDPILLTAFVSEAGLPVTGCEVRVEVTRPDGSTATLDLYDDGGHDDGEADDGEYAVSFPHTTVPGIYHLRFTAVGRSRDGEPVRREALRDKTVLSKTGEEPPPVDRRLHALLQENNDLLRRMLDSGDRPGGS
ncbi:choice-of-anchor D domain-containing protein [Streptomyces sp. NBC_00249]|uniref:choice-of-anchor D domain-containing protein n=1 Tax=Streptomyces sp. NBC_00249 TaxID=2975690 RepID=UPI0022537BD3|nr:choice-of-anchor D domain-containing protein [Streptomyces sp. NBC_00249]MCX5199351.1 choice-of-anchor D domain-containing protein [Streptomyces sp. NBC_00249]